jgi:hypothetical protein
MNLNKMAWPDPPNFNFIFSPALAVHFINISAYEWPSKIPPDLPL